VVEEQPLEAEEEVLLLVVVALPVVEVALLVEAVALLLVAAAEQGNPAKKLKQMSTRQRTRYQAESREKSMSSDKSKSILL